VRTWRKERQAWQAKRTKAQKRADAIDEAVKMLPTRRDWAVAYIDGQLSEEDARAWLVELDAHVEALAAAYRDYMAKYNIKPKKLGDAMMVCAKLIDDVQTDLVMGRLWPRAKLQANAGLDLLGRRM
jgi:hypothetical protein